MKIVHIMGYFVPELGYQEYYLAREHKRLGHDVYVIASDMLYPFPNIENMLKEAGIADTSRKKKPGYSEIDGIKVYRLKHYFEFVDFILCAGVKRLLEEIRPDVVFSHESRQGLPAMAARYNKKLGYKLIVDQHDFYHKIPNHPKWRSILRSADYRLLRNRLVKKSMGKSDKVVAVTKQTYDFVKKTYNIPDKKLYLIPLGVDTDSFSFSEAGRQRIRNIHGINEGDVAILFAGTIVRRKGIEVLLRAFSRIKSENIRLLIAGGGDENYMHELKSLSKELNIDKKTVFAGFVNRIKLPEYFSAADIGVWPGNNSVIIMEAMSCSLPIVMVDLQLSHLVGYENGFKFRENDMDSLKEHLERLCINPDLRRKMGENSCKAIMGNYSYREIAKQFLELAK